MTKVVHSASGAFTSVDSTLSSQSPFFLISPGKLVLTHVGVITIQLFWIMMDHLLLKEFRWKSANANWDEFQHLCRTCLHHSVMNDADDLMSLFTSVVKDFPLREGHSRGNYS